MQIKRLRSDFIVREVSALKPVASGKHALYELRKSGITTHDAIHQIAGSWNIPRDRISHAGLKDKHAETSQFLSIESGPRYDLELPSFVLAYQGQCFRPVQSSDIVANEFKVSLRRLDKNQAERMLEAVVSPALCIANYFDNQRFGSLGESGQFIAHAWCLGNFEQALFLSLAENNPHDRPDDREQKEILRKHWGDWATCKAMLARSHTRSVITYLVDHPMGFKKAVALIRRDLRSLYVAAFQSKLWNEVAGAYLRSHGGAEGIQFEGRAGSLWVPTAASEFQIEEWKRMRIPLPSGRKTEWPQGVEPILDAALAPFNMQRHQLRFSYPRDVFFARGQRELLLRPMNVQGRIDQDETSQSGQVALRLEFSLPAAQYATILIKAIEAAASLDSFETESEATEDEILPTAD